VQCREDIDAPSQARCGISNYSCSIVKNE
jgi:hypothetical protein